MPSLVHAVGAAGPQTVGLVNHCAPCATIGGYTRSPCNRRSSLSRRVGRDVRGAAQDMDFAPRRQYARHINWA